jgi:hypothetical protein
MSTFSAPGATVTFEALYGDYEESRAARVAIQEIPGGDDIFVDTAGRSPLRWKMQMALDNETVWGALNAVIGQAGTLSVDTLTSHAAILLSASRRAPYLDGTTVATAEFLITDA